jgi:hypothetical protein
MPIEEEKNRIAPPLQNASGDPLVGPGIGLVNKRLIKTQSARPRASFEAVFRDR